jgi:hypothetical protein
VDRNQFLLEPDLPSEVLVLRETKKLQFTSQLEVIKLMKSLRED